MSRYFTSSVAAAALMSVLASPVLAQDAPAAPAAPEAAHGQPQQVELPKALRDIGLTDLTSKPTRRGTRVSGRLPDGVVISALVGEGGELRGIRGRDDAAIPRALIDRLVPQPVRNQAIFGELGQIDAIFLGERGVMLSGRDAQAKPVRAAFAEDGTLMRFGRGDDEGRGPGMGPDEDGDHRRDHGKRHGGDRGPRGDRMGDHREDHKGPRHEGRKGPEDRQRDAGQDGPATAPSADAVRSGLTEAGYTAIGQILQQGRVTVAQATNPEGEAVLVEVAPNGRVVRELNR